MKTVRELLLERHRTAEPKLDALRQRAVGMLAQRTGEREVGDNEGGAFARTWLSALRGMRWHLAGLSAAWLAIVLLNIDHTPAASTPVAEQHVPSARQLMAALRENRRQLMEMIGTPTSEPVSIPPRRSEYVALTALA